MYSQSELRELDIEAWKEKLEGGEPEESARQIKAIGIAYCLT